MDRAVGVQHVGSKAIGRSRVPRVRSTEPNPVGKATRGYRLHLSNSQEELQEERAGVRHGVLRPTVDTIGRGADGWKSFVAGREASRIDADARECELRGLRKHVVFGAVEVAALLSRGGRRELTAVAGAPRRLLVHDCDVVCRVSEFADITAVELERLYADGAVDPVAVWRAVLERIDAWEPTCAQRPIATMRPARGGRAEARWRPASRAASSTACR